MFRLHLQGVLRNWHKHGKLLKTTQ